MSLPVKVMSRLLGACRAFPGGLQLRNTSTAAKRTAPGKGAGDSSSSTSSSSAPNAPPAQSSSNTAAGQSAAGSDSVGESARGSTFFDPTFLIPFLGIPALALYYGYQMKLQQEHQSRIWSQYESADRLKGVATPGGNTPETGSTPFEIQRMLFTVLGMNSNPAVRPQPSAAATVPLSQNLAPDTIPVTPAPSHAHPKHAVPDVLTHPPATPSEVVTDQIMETASHATLDVPAGVTNVAEKISHQSAHTQPDSAFKDAAGTGAAAHPAAAAAPKAATQVQQAVHAAALTASDTAQDSGAASTSKAPVETSSTSTSSDATAAEVVMTAVQDASTFASGTSSTAPSAAATVTNAPPAVAAAAAVPDSLPVLGQLQQPSVPPVRKGTMGVAADLTPADLIQHASSKGRGPPSWDAYPHHHQQAVADAEMFATALQQAAAWHQDQIASIQQQLKAAEDKTGQAVKLAQDQAQQFKRLLRHHQAMAAELRELEVRQAEKRVSLAASHSLEKERVAAAQKYDEVRLGLNALASAHEARTGQQACSSLSHTITLGVLDLDTALSQGLPVAPVLMDLVNKTQAVAPLIAKARPQGTSEQEAGNAADLDTDFIKAVAQSVPGVQARSGIPTVQQLTDRLRSMHSTVSALALLPQPSEQQSSGGALSHALAQFFAWFKVNESDSARALGPDHIMQQEGSGIDAALASAQVYLANGKIQDAVHVLRHASHGTAAAAALDAWCKDAAARASAEQAMKLLKAHAGVLAASVV